MKAAPLRSTHRRRTVRTPALVAAEELGLALARVCIASPEFRADFTAGFTLGLKEDQLGRAPNLAAACGAAIAAGAKVADAHAIKMSPPAAGSPAGDPRKPASQRGKPGDGARARKTTRRARAQGGAR